MRFSLVLIFVIILFGCQPSLNNDTPENFANSVFNVIKNPKIPYQEKLLLLPSDVSLLESEELKKEIKDLFNGPDGYNEYKQERLSNLNRFLEKSKQLGIDWNKAKFKSATFKIVLNKYLGINEYDNFFVYFDFNGQEYRFEILNTIKVGEKIKNFSLINLINVNDEIHRLESEDFQPRGVYVSDRFYWTYNFSNLNRFNSVQIDLINESIYDLTSIKYRILLKVIKPNSNTTVFSKTYEYNEKLFKGDRVRIEVEELRNFHVDVNVSEGKHFFMDSEILDVRPHPILER